jgi:hypothetical protein
VTFSYRNGQWIQYDNWKASKWLFLWVIYRSISHNSLRVDIKFTILVALIPIQLKIMYLYWLLTLDQLEWNALWHCNLSLHIILFITFNNMLRIQLHETILSKMLILWFCKISVNQSINYFLLDTIFEFSKIRQTLMIPVFDVRWTRCTWRVIW